MRVSSISTLNNYGCKCFGQNDFRRLSKKISDRKKKHIFIILLFFHQKRSFYYQSKQLSRVCQVKSQPVIYKASNGSSAGNIVFSEMILPFCKALWPSPDARTPKISLFCCYLNSSLYTSKTFIRENKDQTLKFSNHKNFGRYFTVLFFTVKCIQLTWVQKPGY